MKNQPGLLYLIPVHIGGHIDVSLPKDVINITLGLKEFIAENERSARRFLLSIGYKGKIEDIIFHKLNKHTSPGDIPGFLESLKTGRNIGLLSESGCPCVADPGRTVVYYAQSQGYIVKPLTGPNSMLLALMASGLNGQSYCFNGYLPIKKYDRINAIKKLEKRVASEGSTQIFMEAPYRNNSLFDDLLNICNAGTLLCIAADITTSAELIQTKRISDWKKSKPNINKRPVVFLLGQQ